MTHLDSQLDAGLVISVQGISKAPPKPLPQPPRWLARFLPGVRWSSSAEGNEADIDDDEDDLDDEDLGRRAMPLKELSFDVAAGDGLGVVGPDLEAGRTLCLMLAGFIPPSTGRVLIRGGVAPLFGASDLNVGRLSGKKAITTVGRFLGWPLDLIGDRWGEIQEWAELEKIAFPRDSIEYDLDLTKRLLLSTVLHLPASLYIVMRNLYMRDPEFTARCYEMVHQRQREGAAVIQTGLEVEDVSRFCHEAVWIESGEVKFSGRLSEVAKAVSERVDTDEVTLMTRVPLRAKLLSGPEQEIGSDGGTIDIELDVFTTGLEVSLALVFTAQFGRETRVQHPDIFSPADPGIYRLRMAVPGGLLDDGSYRAVLYAASPNIGWDSPHELLSFTVLSESFSLAEDQYELGRDSMVMPDVDDIDVEPADVEWSISRG